MPAPSKRPRKRKIARGDSEYLLHTDFLRAAPEEGKSQVLACLAPVNVLAGERFIRQGDEADCLYLIQKGSCTVNIEKNGTASIVTRRKSGELVGEMSILTGDRRTAHVDAETDMALWRMSRVEFDELCRAYPDIREFITELVTKRISDSKFTPHRTIGKYIITDVIDEGGWGIVYKGVHESLNLPVAIKMLKHAMAMDKDFTTKFEHEAHVIARLNHPNIVRVYDINHLYRTIFIVMEYLPGHSLKHILADARRIPFQRAMNFLIQVGEGLEYAHEEGIVHQDIKPDNIFVRSKDRIKIIDFGLACPTGSGDDLDMPGTPYYMAPEQINGDTVDARTDVYSFGIMAFEMLTGQKPFPGPEVADILKDHCRSSVPDLCLLGPDAPAGMNDFVQRATQKNPSMRHQSMGHVLADLRLLSQNYHTIPATRTAGPEQTLLLMSYHDVDRRELTRAIDDFKDRLRQLGVDFRMASFNKK